MGYADPSCFGNPHVQTPNIDRLAADGIKLSNFYVNSPICSASRVALTTGQYQGRWKVHSYLQKRSANAERGMADFLDPKAPTTARALKDKGYATAHFGKWHMGGGRDVDDAPRPQAYGFDESLVSFEGMGDKLLWHDWAVPGTSEDMHGPYTVTKLPKHKLTETYADRSIDFITRNKKQPFYLRLFPNDVHDAHVPVPGTDTKWKAVTDNAFDQKFFAVLEEMDRQLGRVIDTIDTLGLAEETLILFTSDNGPTDWPKYYGMGTPPPGFTGPFFGRKWSLYEGGIRMPFIARWTGTIPAGQVDDSSVMSAIDISPTLRRFAGAAAHPAPDGYDCGDVLLGTAAARPAPVFWQYGAPHAKLMPGKREHVSPSLAVRDGDWKLLANRDGSKAQLFNLIRDPGETTNLLDDEPARAAALWTSLQIWAKDVGFEAAGTLAAPEPLPEIETLGWRHADGELQLEAHDIIQQGSSWFLNGSNSWLSLSKAQAPKVAGRGFRILATIEPRSSETNGVILAHGGNRMGYALHLENRLPVFVVTADWKRSVLRGITPIPSGQRTRLNARLQKDGKMTLEMNGQVVATGTTKLLKTEPGDSIEIGADLIQPVGDYAIPNAYGGAIHHLRLDIDRP